MGVDDSYTKALLHCEEADGSTNFIDESGKSWTAGGDAQIDDAQKKFGFTSGLIYISAGASRVYTADHADFEPGANDFTVDCWGRTTSLGSNEMLFSKASNAADKSHAIRINTDGSITIYAYAGGSDYTDVSAVSLVDVDTWYHFAYVRYGRYVWGYIDGIRVAEIDFGSVLSYNDLAYGLAVGNLYSTGASWSPWHGWFDEYRYSAGIARWITPTFSPPGLPYGIGGGAKMMNLTDNMISSFYKIPDRIKERRPFISIPSLTQIRKYGFAS